MGKMLTGAVCAIAAISLTACGSSKPSDPGASAATASLKAELLQQSADHASPFTFTDAQAQCTASTVVTALGSAKLQKYGLLDSSNKATSKTLDDTTLSTADATSVVDAFVDCLGSSTFTKALGDAVTTNLKGAASASQRSCLTTKLTAAALKPVLIASLSGDPKVAATFYAELAACIPKK